MGLFKKTPAEKAAISEMKAADQAARAAFWRDFHAGVHQETPESRELQRKANEAAAKVPLWHGGTKKTQR